MTTSQFESEHEARLAEIIECHGQLRDDRARQRQRKRDVARARRAEESQRRRLARLKPVCVVNLDGTPGESFLSIFHVASEFGVNPHAVRESIRQGYTMRIGLRFCYAGEEPKPRRKQKIKKLVRVFDGKVIESMTKVVGPCGSDREFRRQLQQLARAVRSGKRYRRWIYAYHQDCA